jgi:tRNA A-37 threonylcarbamoyl transferase component Bud32/tetratricopeptide (TPR) repeat protein
MAVDEIQIPGIELLTELGRGTHSVVYRARGRTDFCVVKLPLRNETGLKLQILSRRFRREAIALARLRHPLLPRVMEVGVVARSPYIVTELVIGETLAERLLSGPLTEERTVALGRHLASALMPVHQSGLVHRDIKPRSIVFDRTTQKVRLVDFGFAASVDAAFRILEPVGILEYAAPEQISDVRQRVDGRADLYALGCVLYECLAGSPPFSEVDPRRLLHQHRGLEPPDVRQVAPHVSPALASIVKRLLARLPDDRYPTAAAVSEALERVDQLRSGSISAELQHHRAGDSAPLSPLFGREAEYQRLLQCWSDAQPKNRAVVMLHGAPGSGKTRLARAFRDHVVASGQRVLAAERHAWDPKPFSAVRELVEAFVQPSRDVSPDDRAKAVSQVRELAGDLAPLLKVLSSNLSLIFTGAAPVPESRDAQHIFVEGMAEFLVRILRHLGTAVVFVDDVQWLDSSSRSVLRRAMDRTQDLAIFYLFAARGELENYPATETERFLLGPAVEQIALGRIDERTTAELIGTYLGDDNLDPVLLRSVAQLSDGTPLSVLEILRMMLDEGLIVPSWGVWKFDHGAVARMQLPGSTQEVLERRIQSLDEMTKSTLSAAAVVGMTFSDRLLPSICGLEEGHTTAALAEARRAMLVEAGPLGTHSFVNDSVKEALLMSLTADVRQELHQRTAEALAVVWRSLGGAPTNGPYVWPHSSEDPDADICYALATHYAKGVPGRTPDRLYDSNLAAGRLAFQSFDNERALRFFGAAIEASRLLPAMADPELAFFVGEAHLRTGALDESLRQFRRVLEASADALKQAMALTRIAWIHEMRLDSASAWMSLEQAFGKLGERFPTDSVRSVVSSLVAWLLGMFTAPRRVRDGAEHSRLETLCAAYCQATRVASEDGKPLRMIQAALRGLAPAERLGPSTALIRIYVTLSFILTAVGLRKLGRRYLDRALLMARSIGDPVAFAHVLQVHSVTAAWAGNTREALEIGARCLKDYGHWRELSEYCLLCYDQQMLEAVRGRCLVAWDWIEHAIDKANQDEATAHVLEFLELGARAALTSLGREGEAAARLQHLERITVPVPKDSGFYVGTHGPRVRALTERGDFGQEFERIVTEFRSMRYHPKRVHLSATEYYVHVAHARVHTVLRAERWEGARLDLVRDALADLKAAARIPLIEAHALVIEGYWAMFCGANKRAERFFTKAERVAEEEGAPWVLYSVHRGRAHLDCRRAKHDSARRQAKLAEAIAVEHGMAYRLAWIREEFDNGDSKVKDRPVEISVSLVRSDSSSGTFAQPSG